MRNANNILSPPPNAVYTGLCNNLNFKEGDKGKLIKFYTQIPPTEQTASNLLYTDTRTSGTTVILC